MKPEPTTWEELELERLAPERWGPRRWLKQCVAVDAETGKRCSLLEHGPAKDHNASGRFFRNPLAAGAAPRRELDRFASEGTGQ